MRALAHLWREHRLPLLVFVGGAAVALFFAARLVVFTLYWSDPAHRQQTPDGWMTPGYIARSWHVPREDLSRHLGLEPGPDTHLTLAKIAGLIDGAWILGRIPRDMREPLEAAGGIVARIEPPLCGATGTSGLASTRQALMLYSDFAFVDG